MLQNQDTESQQQFISTEEAQIILHVTREEIEALIAEGKLSAYRIGENVLRLNKDQVSELKAQWRIERGLFPENQVFQKSPAQETAGPSFPERVSDFLYFNDFYVISSVVIATLVYLIISSQ